MIHSRAECRRPAAPVCNLYARCAADAVNVARISKVHEGHPGRGKKCPTVRHLQPLAISWDPAHPGFPIQCPPPPPVS